MKKINILFIAIVFVLIGTSCENEDFTDQASVSPVSGVTMDFDVSDVQNTYMEPASEENSDTVRVTLNLNKPQPTADIIVYAEQVGGDATLGEDVIFINEDGNGAARKVFRANQGTTSVTWTMVTLFDCLAEGTETIELQFGDERTANASLEPVTVSFSIENYRAEIPVITMEWGTDLAGDDLEIGDLSVAGDIDMDLYLLNSGFQFVAQYSAATGSNPEVMKFANPDGTPLANGVYYLYALQYWPDDDEDGENDPDENPFQTGPDLDPIEYPLFFNFDRCGGELNTDAVITGLSTDGTYDEAEDRYYPTGIIPFIITVEGSTITVNDGEVDIASGKMEEIRAQILNK